MRRLHPKEERLSLLSVASEAQTETTMVLMDTDTMVLIMVRSLNPLVQTEFGHQPAEDLHQVTFAAETLEDLLLAPSHHQL